jgi:hypothetical protein
LACGSFDTFLHQLSNLSAQQVLLAHTAWLTDAERHNVVQDFELGREHLKMEGALKSSAFQCLPLKILSLGHPSVDVARLGISQAMIMFDNLPDGHDCHPLVRRLFADGDVRDQIIQFVQGVAYDALPLVCLYRSKFMFVPINEASVERRHAEIHKKISLAPRHTGPFVSLNGLRKHELQHFVLQHPAELVKLERHHAASSTPRGVLYELGLQAHEEVLPYVDATGSVTQVIPHTIVAALVYRCDLTTQFMALPEFERRLPPGHGAMVDSDDDDGIVQDQAAVVQEVAVVQDVALDPTFENLDQVCSFEHFQTTAQPHVVYAMKKSWSGGVVGPGSFFKDLKSQLLTLKQKPKIRQDLLDALHSALAVGEDNVISAILATQHSLES